MVFKRNMCAAQRIHSEQKVDSQEKSLSSLYYIPGGFEHLYQHEIYRTTEEVEQVQRARKNTDNDYHKCNCQKLSFPSAQDDEYIIPERYNSFEDRHRQDALNQGFHHGVSAHNKKDRKKRYRRERKKSNSGITRETVLEELKYMDPSARQEFLFCMKALTGSSNITMTTQKNMGSPENIQKSPEKLTNCCTGSWSADRMNNDEILRLHEKFLTGLQIQDRDARPDVDSEMINESFLRDREMMLYL